MSEGNILCTTKHKCELCGSFMVPRLIGHSVKTECTNDEFEGKKESLWKSRLQCLAGDRKSVV